MDSQNVSGRGIMFSVIAVTILYLIFASNVEMCWARPKLVFTSSNTCDRYSLDALYHEKYKIVTEEVLTDSAVFVKNVMEKVEDSLQQVMLQLPGDGKSSREEMVMHQTMTSIKDVFTNKMKKLHNNITSHWNKFIETNHGFLSSNKNVTFNTIVKYVSNVYDAYEEGRKIMDGQMERVISSVKVIVQNGFLALRQIIESGDHHKHENVTENANKTEEAKLKDIIGDVIPAFLRTVTEKILERKVNLSIPVTKTVENRDSVLDDLCFLLAMMKAKVRAIEPEEYASEEYVDLARRNLYILWADIVNSVYKDKISKKSTDTPRKGNATEKFEKFWSDEDELANTLVSLMEVYP